jgi:hypothetical protein
MAAASALAEAPRIDPRTRCTNEETANVSAC